MSLIDLFNPSFLAFLGILVLVASVLVVYFESKYREQNHKITSMFSIVSTLAEDLNNVKCGINDLVLNGITTGGSPLGENVRPFIIQEKNNLIEVSDDEESEEEESDEEDDDDEDEDESDSDSDSESDDDETIVKVLKISDPLSLLEKVEQNFEDLDSDSLLEKVEENFEDLDSDPLLEKVEENFEDLDLEDILDEENYDQEGFEEDEPLQLVETIKNNKNEKSIKINLGEAVNDVIDYKKLTLQKLKSIVVEKGLAVDTSKLKKPDLLKLLGIE